MPEFELLQAMATRWDDGPIRLHDDDTLNVQLLGGGELQVQIRSAEDAAVLTTTWQPQTALDWSSLSRLAAAGTRQGRGELMCEPTENGIQIRNIIWLEGVSRQSFTVAVFEVARTYQFLHHEVMTAGAGSGAQAAMAMPQPQAQPAPSPAPQPTPAAQPAPTSQPTPSPAATTAPPAAPAPAAAAAWTPTHRVPPQGATSWAQADPSSASVPLGGGLELEVVQRLGDWAQVRASNGWTGWVDGRILQPR
jgi:hypothetical protein